MKIFCLPKHHNQIRKNGIFPLVRLNLWMDSHAHIAAQSYMLKQFEHPQRCENSGFSFDMVQLEMNGTDRLVGAVINTPETGRCFFALAIINNHDSDKAFLQDLPLSLEQLRQDKRALPEIGNTYWLCATEQGRALLAKHPELATMITPDALNAIVPDSGASAAYWLCATEQGCALLLQHRHLATMITPEALNTIVPDFGASAAYWLCAAQDGRKLLKEFRELAKMITPEALNAIFPTSGASAVYWLCATEDGHKLLEEYPELVEIISDDALNTRLPKTAGANAGKSATYMLCGTDSGRKLLKKYSKLVGLISDDALNAILPKTAGADAGKSAIFMLFLTEDGRNLLKKHPKLLRVISTDVLNARLPKCDNLSAIFLLCLNNDGRELLKQYPQLVKMITPEGLNAKLLKSNYLSAAYGLCAYENGFELLDKHPELMDMIRPDVLNAIMPDSGESAVFQLCVNKKGLALLERNPYFTQKISGTALNQRLPKSAGAFAGKSATYMLCSTTVGRAILAKCSWLAELITDEALNARAHDGTRASSRLCIDPEGRELLAQYPRLAEMIPKDVLEERVPHSPDPSMSVAFLLCATNNGRELLKQNRTLMKKINPKDLNAILREYPGIPSGTSAIFKLCAADNGREVLLKYPGLENMISAEALNSKLLESADVGNSAVFELCATDNGRKVLLESPKLAQKILPDALNAILLETATANPGTSAAYWLCATEDGRAILEKYPHLVEIITPASLSAILLKSADTDKSPAMLRCPTQDGRALLKLLIAALNMHDYQAFRHALKSIQRKDILINLTPTWAPPANPKDAPPAPRKKIQSPLEASPAIAEPEVPYIEFNWGLLKKYLRDANSISLVRDLKNAPYEATLKRLFSENNVYEIYELLSFKNYQYRYQFTRIASITPYIARVIEDCIKNDNLELFNQLTLLKPFLESLQKQQTYFLDLCMLQPEQSRRILNTFLEDDLLKSQYISAPIEMIKRAIEHKIWNVVEKCLPMLDEATLTAEFGFLKAELEANGKPELLPLKSRRCESPPQISPLTFSMFQPESPGFVPRQHLPQPLIELVSLLNTHLQKPCILTGSAVANLFLKRPHHSDYDCLVLGVSLESLKQFLRTHGFPKAEIIGKTYPTLKLTIKKIEIEIATDACWAQEPIDTYMQRILAKRDFTISALYIDLSTDKPLLEIKAFDGALEKTEKGKISVVSNGDGLFEEDPIRLLRLLKISMQYTKFEPDDHLRVVLSRCNKSGCFNKFLSANELHAARISTFFETLFSKFPEMDVIENLIKSDIFEALTGISNDDLDKNSDVLEHYFQEITQDADVENQSHAYLKKMGFFFFCTALYCLLHDKKSNLEDWPFFGVIQRIKKSDTYCLAVLQDFMWNQERETQYEGTSLYRMLDRLKKNNSASILKP